jgi:hypothetical protein
MSSRDIANLKNGLVAAWIPSLGSTGYRLVDRVGGNHGVLTNMDAGSAWRGRRNGLWLDFDGVNDSATIGNISSANVGTGSYTIAFWLFASPFAATSAVFAKDDVNLGTTGFLFYSRVSLPNEIVHYSSFSQERSFGAIADSSVHHCVVSRSSTAANDTRQYLDGKLIATYTDSANYTNALSLTIGNDVDLDRPFPGSLNDIRLYSRALTPPEVRLLAIEPGIGFKRTARSAFAEPISYKPPKDKTYAAITRSQSDYDSLREGLVLAICPSVSGATGYRAVDVSGRGNHGTLTNMDAASDWVVSNGMALDFDGSDDYVNVPASYYGTGAISFWLKTTTEIGAALAFGTSASSSTLMYVAIGQNISGTLTNELITVATISGTARIEGYTTATRTELLDGNWHHVAVVQETANASYKIYLDGNLKTTTVGDATLTTFGIGVSGGDVIQFGSRRFQAAQGVYYTGQADDIRLYRRPLTPPEIRQLASRRGIGLRSQKQTMFYQFPSGSKRRRILTGMT